MARDKKASSYEVQAKAGMALAALGALSALALCVCVFWRFRFDEFTATYMAGGLRFYVILVAALGGLATGAIGFFLSLNAAGRRRNPLSNVAWAAFFVNAGVLLVTLCVFVVFVFARDPVYPRT